MGDVVDDHVNCDRGVVKKYCKKHLSTALYFFSGEVDDVRVWKRSILLFVGIAVLLLSTLTVSAVTETDATEDIWYIEYNLTESTFKITSKNLADYPEIDITSVGATLDGSTLTLTMTLDSAVDSTKFASYVIYYGAGETEAYMVTYLSNTGIAIYMAVGIDGFDMGTSMDALSNDQKTITVSFDITECSPFVLCSRL